jgi:hypothetical protein
MLKVKNGEKYILKNTLLINLLGIRGTMKNIMLKTTSIVPRKLKLEVHTLLQSGRHFVKQLTINAYAALEEDLLRLIM